MKELFTLHDQLRDEIIKRTPHYDRLVGIITDLYIGNLHLFS